MSARVSGSYRVIKLDAVASWCIYFKHNSTGNVKFRQVLNDLWFIAINCRLFRLCCAKNTADVACLVCNRELCLAINQLEQTCWEVFVSSSALSPSLKITNMLLVQQPSTLRLWGEWDFFFFFFKLLCWFCTTVLLLWKHVAWKTDMAR